LLLVGAGIPWEALSDLTTYQIRLYMAAIRRIQIQNKLDTMEACLVAQAEGKQREGIVSQWVAQANGEEGSAVQSAGPAQGMSIAEFTKFLGGT
jgi:hypothetical protein